MRSAFRDPSLPAPFRRRLDDEDDDFEDEDDDLDEEDDEEDADEEPWGDEADGGPEWQVMAGLSAVDRLT
jgi:hypothetical protein